MHAKTSLQQSILKSLSDIHLTRAKSIYAASESLLNGAALTVTSIGRHLSGDALEKSKIHRSNELIGNGHLNADRLKISKHQVEMLFGGREKLLVLVDWSGCCSDERFIVQASIANNGLGRSYPIHSKIFPKGTSTSQKAHKAFLSDLQYIFSGIDAQIILVTDAGFYSNWFKQVLAIGWDFVGRIRGTVHIKLENKDEWQTVPDI